MFVLTDIKGKIKIIQQNGKDPIKKEENADENNDEDDDNASLSNMKYEDPGAFMDDQSVDSPDTQEYMKQIHGQACALLQIAQSIDVKYFKPPYGNLKSGGKHGTKEENAEKAERSFERWQVSLMKCQTSSQLFLHYNVLYDAIKWTRSAQNAKCSCRSSKDPDKLLLCDGCNIGRHIYCLKPKLTVNLFVMIFTHFQSWHSWSHFVFCVLHYRKCLKVIGSATDVSLINSRHHKKRNDKHLPIQKMKMRMM